MALIRKLDRIYASRLAQDTGHACGDEMTRLTWQIGELEGTEN